MKPRKNNTLFSGFVTAVVLEACKQNFDMSFGRDSHRRHWVDFYHRNGLPSRLVGHRPTSMPNVEKNLHTVNGKTVFVMA